ncbi:MAG TPA: WYL domain-containing protein [Gemmatimonadaceae bacterium]|nr:WYL domain-containing protein [Gemmatimonadaceae bacterium]
MTADAAMQLRRLLHIIPRLADGEAHPIEQVARMARTDVDTVLRDLYSLAQRFGDPGGFVPGLEITIEGARVTLRSGHFARPMRLTSAELCALELGLAMLARECAPEERGAIERARARLGAALAMLPPSERAGGGAGGRHAELGAEGDAALLAAIRGALRARRKVRLDYRSASAAEPATRTICPYGLVAARGAWYVVAHCEERDAIRIFRLDRIERAVPLAERFEIPPSFSLESVVRNGAVFSADEPGTLRVRYSANVARWIAEREGVPLDADGSLTVEHPLADLRWAVRHVLQYGPDAEVLEPESVRREVRSKLLELLEE